MNIKLETKIFYKSFLSIGLPLVIQQLVSSSLNFIDNLMIGRLGTDYIAAVGFANNVYRILELFLFGIFSGMGVFIAQYYGKKNFEIIRKILGGMLVVGISMAILFSLVANFGASKIIGIFTKDMAVLGIGISYLRKVLYSYIFLALSFGIGFSLRSMGKTKFIMFASILGVITNTILNYCLIYGNFGFPKLAEKGAAYATVFARAVEFVAIIYIVKKYDFNIKGKISGYFGLSRNLIKEIVKVSSPVFFTEMIWILGTVSLTVAYSRLGTNAAASVQIADIVGSISAILFMGISNASSVIVGQTIGKGEKETAILYSRKIIRIAIVMSIVGVILIQLLVKPILSLYDLNIEVYPIALKAVRVYGCFIFFKMINWTILIGLFRAGGDTKVAFLMDTCPLLLYAVPVAFIGAKYNIPVYYLMALANIEEIFKLILAAKRYKSRKWLKDVTV